MIKMKQLNNYTAHANKLAIFSSIFFFSLSPLCNIVTAHETELGGKHIIVSGVSSVAGFYPIRNASGHIVKVGGLAPLMLSWLSQRYQFTYSVLQSNDTSLDASGSQKGLIYHLLSGVWIAMIISLASITLVFHFLHRSSQQKFTSNYLKMSENRREKVPWNMSFYVLGTLLSQGGYLPLKSLPFYYVGGVWCFAAFVIVNAYNSTLIAHVTLPNPQILIKTIYDLRNRPDIYLITDKNLNTDAVLSAADSGFLKILGDKLRGYSKSRCNTTKECIQLVKSGFHVYSSGLNSFLYGAMREDYRETGECNLHLQKESYMNLPISLALPKRSQRMKYIDLGIMQMREAGLLNEWSKKFQPDARQCLTQEKKQTVNPLRLENLTGAFVLLAIGFLASFTAFFGEKLFFYFFKPRI